MVTSYSAQVIPCSVLALCLGSAEETIGVMDQSKVIVKGTMTQTR